MFYAFAEVGGQFLLAFYGGENVFLAFRQLVELLCPLLYAENRHFVHVACGFLSVAAYEWDGGSVGQQIEHCGYELGFQSQFNGND